VLHRQLSDQEITVGMSEEDFAMIWLAQPLLPTTIEFHLAVRGISDRKIQRFLFQMRWQRGDRLTRQVNVPFPTFAPRLPRRDR
jgi:hypothetical protein